MKIKTALQFILIGVIYFQSNFVLAEWVRVERVVDGDTFVTSTGEKIRIKNIDTPETKHPTKGTEAGGYEAFMLAYRYLKGQWVFLEGNGHDQYRRRVALVKLQNTLNYEDIVRRNGLDKNSNSTYRYFRPEHSFSTKRKSNVRLKYLPQSSPVHMVKVDGYYRKNGTYVQSHWKRQPAIQKTKSNKIKTSNQLILNSISREASVQNEAPSSSSSDSISGGKVSVRGYYRKDGTYVRPHTRSYPKKKD